MRVSFSSHFLCRAYSLTINSNKSLRCVMVLRFLRHTSLGGHVSKKRTVNIDYLKLIMRFFFRFPKQEVTEIQISMYNTFLVHGDN